MMKEKFDMISIFSFSITEFWRGMRQNINLIISNMDWYVFKPYFTF